MLRELTLKINKQLKIIVLFLLPLAMMSAFSPFAFAGEDNEVSPANKTQLSLLFGSYSLKGTSTTISSMGAFTVGLTYRFFERVSANAAYNNLLTYSGGLSSVVSGFDIGGAYCFFSCSAMKQKLGDSALIVSWSPWGLQFGAGFAQRSILLSNQSVGFSGPYLKAEGNYMLGDRFKLLGTAQYSSMSNLEKNITQFTIQLGIGFDFGENVYNSVRKGVSN